MEAAMRLQCSITQPKPFLSVISCLSFKGVSTAEISGDPSGLKFAVDRSGVLQGEVFFSKDEFAHFDLKEERVLVWIDLVAFIEALKLVIAASLEGFIELILEDNKLIVNSRHHSVSARCDVPLPYPRETVESLGLLSRSRGEYIIILSSVAKELFSESEQWGETVELTINERGLRIHAEGTAGSYEAEVESGSDAVDHSTMKIESSASFHAGIVDQLSRCFALGEKVKLEIHQSGLLACKVLLRRDGQSPLSIDLFAAPVEDLAD